MVSRMRLLTAALAAALALGAPPEARTYPQVPPGVKENPPGLERPKHLGAEWPGMNLDQQLYSLRYGSMRGSYEDFATQHTIARTTPYPELREQLDVTAYKDLPKEYYGQKPPSTFQQRYEDHSASLVGGTGLIDIPSAFTQRKGTWLGSLGFHSTEFGAGYWRGFYDEGEATDVRLIGTYGLRDDVELTFVTNIMSRDVTYANHQSFTTSGRLYFGVGGKLSYAVGMDDNFQIAAGGMFTAYANPDRDIILMTDYDSIATMYVTASTESRLWAAHVNYKFTMFDYAGDVAPIGAPPGAPADGYGPSESEWGTLGLGLEYRVPAWKMSFMNEIEGQSTLDFPGTKETTWNFGVLKRLDRLDLKAYMRMLNQQDYRQFGVQGTLRF